MKTIKLLSVVLLFLVFSCEKNNSLKEKSYVFVKQYSATVTVGGVVGITEKYFNTGDTVTGYENVTELITIRIAIHSDLNEGVPNPNSYQELLDVPSDNLKMIGK